MSVEFRMRGRGLSRRAFTGGMAGGVVFGLIRPAAGDVALGKVLSIDGELTRNGPARTEVLTVGTSLMESDLLATGRQSFAKLKLGSDTDILLGPETQLLIDRYLAGQGGELQLMSGQMLFDRPAGLPKIDLTVKTTFGMIGVRGTKFFAGPLNGVFSVYVEHGRVDVSNAGVSRRVGAGEGLDIAPPEGSVRSLGNGARDAAAMARLAIPGLPSRWADVRIRDAYASVGLR
ncbi:MAG TPA: FecR family protein [Ensifer sp.]|nr:FecR family protein [Ensifer sp.]